MGLNEDDQISIAVNTQWGGLNPNPQIGNGVHWFNNFYCPEPDGDYPAFEHSITQSPGYTCSVINDVEPHKHQIVCAP